ncbi:MAG: hypothetical protein FJX76_19725 [Armatimonadetes bacterium]|nr:hypothetical protein [Armatimonadota bacterium]
MTPSLQARLALGLILLAGIVAGAFFLWRRPPPPPPEPRATEGAFWRYTPSGAWERLPVPGDLPRASLVVTRALTNVVALPERSWLRCQTDASLVVEAVEPGPRTVLRVDQGRAWLRVSGEAAVVLNSVNCEVTVRDATCAIHVWDDKDHFKNTEVRCWRGSLEIRGGPGLKQSATLRYGQTLKTDDASMSATTSFETASPDPWAEWNQSLDR